MLAERAQQQGVKLTEAAKTSLMITTQFPANHDGFSRLAWQEERSYFNRWFAQAVQAIAPNLQSEHLQPASKVGIRAQMFNLQKVGLETDFAIEQGECSTQMFNAISPAWTSAFPFARYVCENYL